MKYISSTRVIKTRSYEAFCKAMDIPFGPSSERRRTPAESRTAHQFLLAVNANRSSVFFNLNNGISVFVEQDQFRNVRKLFRSVNSEQRENGLYGVNLELIVLDDTSISHKDNGGSF